MRQIAMMVLALGSLAARADADDTVRLFSPAPAGPVTLQAHQTADAPPRALGIRPALDLDAPAGQEQPSPPAGASWQVAPEDLAKETAPPKAAAWQAVTSTSSGTSSAPAAGPGATH